MWWTTTWQSLDQKQSSPIWHARLDCFLFEYAHDVPTPTSSKFFFFLKFLFLPEGKSFWPSFRRVKI